MPRATPCIANILAAILVTVFASPAVASLLSPDWELTEPGAFFFGRQVSTAGDVNGDGYSDVLVSDPFYTNPEGLEGAVFLFLGSAEGPSSSADWSFEPNQQGFFGTSIAPAGDTNGDGYDDFVVGAPEFNDGEPNEGRVFLFAGGPGDPSLLATFEIDEEGAEFGRSVAWAGDVNGDGYDDVLAGAPLWGGFGTLIYTPVQGAVRLYLGGPGGPDTTADWSRSGLQENGEFGAAVAGVGDVNGDGYADVVIGQPRYDLSTTLDSNQGAAHLYLGSASGLSSSPDATLYGGFADARLGQTLAAAGDVDGDGYADALVGAPSAGADAVQIWWGSASGLGSVETVNPNSGLPQPGVSMSTVGDVDGDGFADQLIGTRGGSCWLIRGSATGPMAAETLSGEGSFGWIVGSVGDVDGDGLGDFAISYTDVDIVYIYRGQRDFPGSVQNLTGLLGAAAGDQFGTAADGVGDVNGDGYDDLAVGMPRDGTGAPGRVAVYHGSENGIGTVADWSIDGGTDSRFGIAVAGAGDVDGDGYDDLLIGEPGADAVHVFHGSSGGLSAVADWGFSLPGADFGADVDGAGDVDGDGFADIIVGAPLYDGSGSELGAVHVFFGGPWGVRAANHLLRVGTQSGARFGAAVAGAGDVDANGYDDVAVGSPGWDEEGFADTGAAHLFLAFESGLAQVPETTVSSQPGAALGSAIDGGGDVDGDGFADLVIGGPGRPGAGELALLRGGDPPYSSSAWIFGWDQFGRSVATAGDLTGDGRTDVLTTALISGTATVLAMSYSSNGLLTYATLTDTDDGTSMIAAAAGDLDADGWPEVAMGLPLATGTDRGELNVYRVTHYDTSSEPVSAGARIRDEAGLPIALRGRMTNAGGLRLEAQGRSPSGRTRVALEWQLSSVGQAFDPPIRAEWVDTGSVGSGPTEVEDSLDFPLLEGGRYRWRLRVAAANPWFPHGRWMTNEPGAASLRGFTVGSEVTAVAPPPSPGQDAVRLALPYPNPFNPRTTLAFDLPRAGTARIRIYDAAGRRVRKLFDARAEAGRHAVVWNGDDDDGQPVSSGSYLAVLTAGELRSTRKLVLVR